MEKRALVISGGGAKGAFAVGVLQHLIQERGLEFDLVAGTSTGGLIAPLALMGEVDTLVDVYSNVETDDILETRDDLFRVLRSDSFFKVKPLYKLIKDTLTSERVDRILDAANKEMFVSTINLQSQKTTYFHTSANPRVSPERERDVELIRIEDRETMVRAVLATACIPFYMPPVRIPKGSGLQYLDGGVRDVAPIQIAIENGATEIYAVVLTPVEKNTKDKLYSGITSILERTTDVFSSEIMLNDINSAQRISHTRLYMEALKRRIRQRFSLTDDELDDLIAIDDQDLPDPNPFFGKQGVRLITIRPQTGAEVPGGTLDFKKDRMRDMIVAGRSAAVRTLGEPAPVIA